MKLFVILASGCLAVTAAFASIANAVPVTAASFTPPPKGAQPVVVASFRNATPFTRDAATASINAQRRAQAVNAPRTVDMATTTEPDTFPSGQ